MRTMRPIALAMPLVLLAACANTGPATADSMLSDANFRIVTARDAAVGRGPLGIADRFTLNGKMVAYVNINWPEGHAAWGKQTFESRWYMGDKLVVRRETEFSISRSPFHFWSNVLPITLGPGHGRYEVYAGGRKLGSASFDIVAPSGAASPSPGTPATFTPLIDQSA